MYCFYVSFQYMAQIPRCIVSIHCKISKCIVSIHDENAKCIERIQPYRQSSAAGENFHNQYVVFRFSCWKIVHNTRARIEIYLSISQMYWINTCIVSIHAKFSNPGCIVSIHWKFGNPRCIDQYKICILKKRMGPKAFNFKYDWRLTAKTRGTSGRFASIWLMVLDT